MNMPKNYSIIRLRVYDNALPSERIQKSLVSSNSFFISVLAISLSFDMKLPNGKSTRHPDANQFIESMNEQVHQAIEVYDKAPLGRM
jgi:hypothetical protein